MESCSEQRESLTENQPCPACGHIEMPPPLVLEASALRANSKFMLTIRLSDEWIYGVGFPKGNERTYVSRYERHNQEVLEYLRDRPDDPLVLRITQGEGGEKLCPFLNEEIPPVPFPHANRAATRELQKLLP